jgi:hypothetical protein
MQKGIKKKNTIIFLFPSDDLGFGFFKNEGFIGVNIIINIFVLFLHLNEFVGSRTISFSLILKTQNIYKMNLGMNKQMNERDREIKGNELPWIPQKE